MYGRRRPLTSCAPARLAACLSCSSLAIVPCGCADDPFPLVGKAWACPEPVEGMGANPRGWCARPIRHDYPHLNPLPSRARQGRGGWRKGTGPRAYSRKSRSFFERLGCRSLRRALASIWRMRSLVTPKSWPTSSSVRCRPSSRPNRSWRTLASRSLRV